MTNRLLVRWLLACALLVNAAACSTIKSWFPDKERDYQFRTEIPELIVPEDLKGKTLPERTPEQMAAAAVSNAEAVPEEQATPVDEQKTASNSAKPKEPETTAASEDKPVATVAASNASVSSLQIDQSRNQAWRLVARALSRERMEIVERNFDKGYFYVNYDPKAIKPEDGSLWDEVTFLFGADPSNEQEYRISLHEIAPQVTEVTIQDSNGTTLSNDVATALLKLITDGINQTLPEKSQDGAAEETSTWKAQENAPEKSQGDTTDKAKEKPTESMPAP
ncbi:MAG: outer membrane protein assembly factor BamC [Methylomonas sp.]